MFRDRTVTSKFWQFQKKFFFFILNVIWLQVEPVITFDHFYCFWNCNCCVLNIDFCSKSVLNIGIVIVVL